MKNLHVAKGTLTLFALLLIVFPTTWFFLDKTNLLSGLGIIDHNNPPSEWSVTFIGYFGSAFAAIAGYIAVVLSLSIQERGRKEDKAKEVLPLISATPIECNTGRDRTIIYLKHYTQSNTTKSSAENRSYDHKSPNGILLMNVGAREMYDVKIIEVQSTFFSPLPTPIELTPILYRDDTVTFDVMLEARGPQSDCLEITNRTFMNKASTKVVISVSYQDCYGNRYVQKIGAELSYNFEARKTPELIFSGTGVESCSIISAPLPQK